MKLLKYGTMWVQIQIAFVRSWSSVAIKIFNSEGKDISLWPRFVKVGNKWQHGKGW